MSSRAVIDSTEFAYAGETLHGQVPVAMLTRLADYLFDNGGELKYEVAGGRDGRQRPRLGLTVKGSLNLQCQRCLGSLTYPVDVQTKLLVLTGPAAGETAELDDLDGIPADAHTDVWSLVEDETLLAIPLSPRHQEGQCTQPVDTAVERAASPFAALAQLGHERNKN